MKIKKVRFYAEDVTLQNAAWLEEKAKPALSGPVQLTTTLSIPTSAVPAIMSLTTTRARRPTTSTSCAITAHDDLLKALRPMEQ